MKTKLLLALILITLGFGCVPAPALTTVSDMPSIGADLDLTDLIYIINVQSTGGAKDRKGTLAQLITFLEAQGIGGGTVADGSITNVKVASNAAIALSKLATDPLARANHTGTQLMSTISDAGALATLSAVTSATIADATIVNGDLAGNAAVALSKLAALTASRATVTDGSGVITTSSVTATELGYLSGVTSALQTQLGAKQPLHATLTALAAMPSSAGVVLNDGAGGFTVVPVAIGGGGSAEGGYISAYQSDGSFWCSDSFRIVVSSDPTSYQQWAFGAMNIANNGFAWTLEVPTVLAADNIVAFRATASGNIAVSSDTLDFFAPTTSSALLSVITDASGTGSILTTNGIGSGLTSLNADNLASGTAVVARGGSGRASATAYAVICGGTTSTGAHQSIASVGTSGQVLTSNGAGSLPTFQDAAGGGVTIDTTAITSGTAQRVLFESASNKVTSDADFTFTNDTLTVTKIAGTTLTGNNTYQGVQTISPTARSATSASYFTLTTPADTTLTASTESIGANFTAATRQFATGAITEQRERVFAAPTYSAVGASTISDAVNVDIAEPSAGTNVTLTRKYALRAASAYVSGTLTVGPGKYTTISESGAATAISTNTGYIGFYAGGPLRFAAAANGLSVPGNIAFGSLNAETTFLAEDGAAARVKIVGASSAAASLRVAGVQHGCAAKTTTYTATGTDYTITGDATGGSFTITLPAAASHAGRIFVFKKIDATGNTVTIDGNASETIDGATTVVISTQWAGKVIQSDGTNWVIIGSF